QRVGRFESFVQITEPLALGSAARRIVFGIEIEHHLLTLQGFGGNQLVAGRLGLEGGEWAINLDGHNEFLYGFCWRQGSIRASNFQASAKARNWARSQLICVPAGRVTVSVALSMVPPVGGAW